MKAFWIALLSVLLFASCTSSGSALADPYGEQVSRTYRAGYAEVVEETAEAILATGLGIESTAEEDDSRYVIVATRKEQLGASEPITVARLHAYVERLSSDTARVRVETEKISRTSMAGQSSDQRPAYARRIFRRLSKHFAEVEGEG